MTYQIREYLKPNGKIPYRDWLNKLPIGVQARIQARMFRFEQGNLGDIRSIGEGLCEARFMTGPGYRIYFGIEDKELIVLLAGGDKQSQQRDIDKAKSYWNEYQRKTHGTS